MAKHCVQFVYMYNEQSNNNENNKSNITVSKFSKINQEIPAISGISLFSSESLLHVARILLWYSNSIM
jgi:hypothetical protein